MTQRLIFAAAALLILQIGLAVALNMSNRELTMVVPGESFASFAPDKVSSIEITGEKGTMLILKKTETGWIIPASFSAPVNTEQIEQLLDKLANAKQGFAVATTSDAAKRFKTAKDNFERHLIIKEGDTVVADFYLGTTAGFRHSHARKSGKEEVITIPISSFEAEVDVDKWLDKNLAILNKDKLKSVSFADISLQKNDKDWQLASVSAEETNNEEIDTFLNIICGLTVHSIQDPKKVASLFDEKPPVQFTVTKMDETKVTYSLAKLEDDYVLKMSNNDLYFTVSKWRIDDLSKFSRESLSQKTEGKREDKTVTNE